MMETKLTHAPDENDRLFVILMKCKYIQCQGSVLEPSEIQRKIEEAFPNIKVIFKRNYPLSERIYLYTKEQITKIVETEIEMRKQKEAGGFVEA